MTEILVEVVPGPGSPVPLSGPGAERFEDRAAEIAASLGQISEAFQTELERLTAGSVNPTSWTMEELALSLSLNVEAGAGVIIARAKAGATFQASLKWRRGQ